MDLIIKFILILDHFGENSIYREVLLHPTHLALFHKKKIIKMLIIN